MQTRQAKLRLTRKQIANAIKRGIEANYAPEYQEEKRREICELFYDMAMSLGNEVEFGMTNNPTQAERDADILDAIATHLDF